MKENELGNHTLGTKAQNMHQLRVLGVPIVSRIFGVSSSTGLGIEGYLKSMYEIMDCVKN